MVFVVGYLFQKFRTGQVNGARLWLFGVSVAVVDLFSDVPLQDAKANSPMNRKGIRMLFFIFYAF